VLLWLIPTALALWTAVALVGVSLCAAAARGDRYLGPEAEPGDDPRARLARAS
jgi:hypothetical protein